MKLRALRPIGLFMIALGLIQIATGCASYSPSTPPLTSNSEMARQDLVLSLPISPVGNELLIVEKSNVNPPDGSNSQSPPDLSTVSRSKELSHLHPVRTAIHATINGFLASTQICQHFENPQSGDPAQNHPSDLYYEVHLPQSAAVTDFILQIGTRQIRAVIRKRDAAEKIYAEAIRHGLAATLVSESDPGVITVALSGIAPGNPIDANLTYFSTLVCHYPWFSYAVPLGTPGPAGDQSRDAVSLDVHIGEVFAITDVSSDTHHIVVTPEGGGRVAVTLANSQTLPTGIFQLRFSPTSRNPEPVLFTEATPDASYFALMLIPRGPIDAPAPQPFELNLLIDRKDSKSFNSIDAICDEAKLIANNTRQIKDLNINNFSSDALAPALQKVALASPPVGHARITLLVTDKHETDPALYAAARSLGQSSRLLICYAGSGQHPMNLTTIARCAGAAVADVKSPAGAHELLARVISLADTYTISGLTIDWPGSTSSSILPDLSLPITGNQPLLITGTYTGSIPPEIHLHDGHSLTWRVRTHQSCAGVEYLWTRMKLVALGIAQK